MLGPALLLSLAVAVDAPRADPRSAAIAASVVVRADGYYGGGVAVDPAKGLVLTAAHVLFGIRGPIEVSWPDGAREVATAGPSDISLDLAVLQVAPRSVAAPAVGSIVELGSGARLAACGAPRGVPFEASEGSATVLGRWLLGSLFLEATMPLAQGSSGGPVVDERGRVIGLVDYLWRPDPRIGFALPIDYAVERFPWLFRNLPGRDAYLAQFVAWRARKSAASEDSRAGAGGPLAGALEP
ncbi:MAG: S1 family peptidase, partial [Deltaproteobacteria bacterium]